MFQAQRGPQRRSISISSSFCAGKSSDPSQGDDWPQMMHLGVARLGLDFSVSCSPTPGVISLVFWSGVSH